MFWNKIQRALKLVCDRQSFGEEREKKDWEEEAALFYSSKCICYCIGNFIVPVGYKKKKSCLQKLLKFEVIPIMFLNYLGRAYVRVGGREGKASRIRMK